MTSASDRRNNNRHAIELSVEYKRLNTFFADYTRNISKGGTFIRTERPLDVTTEFVFALTIRGLAEPLRLRGRVKWIVSPADATPSITLSSRQQRTMGCEGVTRSCGPDGSKRSWTTCAPRLDGR